VETSTLRVVSHEPTIGRLDLTAFHPRRVVVRLPGGVTDALAVSTSETGDSMITELRAQAGYVAVDINSQQTIALYYALPERTTHYTVGAPGRTLSCIGRWRGETLLHVEPPGAYYPLYQRKVDLEPVQPMLPAQMPLDSL
jgi:hypothetical protein